MLFFSLYFLQKIYDYLQLKTEMRITRLSFKRRHVIRCQIMTAAYSNDLRWRMVYQRLGLDFSYRTIVCNLGVDSSTVYRIVELFLKTRNVEKKKYKGCNLMIKVTAS